jgi:flavin-dependent dehydrogenase
VEAYEVAIVGGGPAGAALGALLAQAGRRVVVIERDTFPRFHIGESLLPMSVEVFDKLGLTPRFDERFIRKYGATFVDSPTGRTSTYWFRDAFDKRFAFAYQVPRDEFDTMLLERTRELGAEVLQPCKVSGVLFETSGDGHERAVGVKLGDGRELRASVVVDATGRGSMLATRNRTKGRFAGLNTSSVFAHYRNVERQQGEAEGHIRIVIFEEGWIWMIPFRGDVSSVGAVVSTDFFKARNKEEDLSAFLERTLAGVPDCVRCLEHAERINEARAAADFSYSVSSLVGDGWLCVGDAGGFIDPLFSSGVHIAFKSAELAAEAIEHALDSGDTSREAFGAYEGHVRAASDLFLGAVQAFYAGEFREMLFADNQRKMLRQMVTSMLAGDVVHHKKMPSWVRFVRGRFKPGQSAVDGQPAADVSSSAS